MLAGSNEASSLKDHHKLSGKGKFNYKHAIHFEISEWKKGKIARIEFSDLGKWLPAYRSLRVWEVYQEENKRAFS